MLDFLGDSRFDQAAAGGKGRELHKLARAGFAVPPGFVIGHQHDLGALSDAELSAAVVAVGGFPVAVRSSGVLEGLADVSFAGHYETFLDVASLSELRAKIHACRDSAQNERVVADLARAKLDPAAARVSVLVQRMVPAKFAGVAFTLHPLTGREEHALVEYVAGPSRHHATPSRAVFTLETGAIVDEEIGPDGARLSQAEREMLAAVLLRVQAHAHAPQDVEFAFDGKKTLYLLQSRPITKVSLRSDGDEFTNADFEDGGISARVCTPVMYSLYRNAAEASMQRYFESLRLIPRGTRQRWIALFYGRRYWNASAVKRALSKVPGFSEERFDHDLGIHKSYGANGPLTVPTNARTVLAAVPVALALERSYRAHLVLVRDLTRTFPTEYAAHLDRIARFPATPDPRFFGDLGRVYLDLHARTEQAYFTTIYNDSSVQSAFKSFVAKMDQATGRATKIADLLGGVADMHDVEMRRGILRLLQVARDGGVRSAAWERALAEFLRHHGEHGDAERDLTVPRWREDPERVRVYVEGILASGAPAKDPDENLRDQQARLECERRAVLELLRWHPMWRVRFLSGFEKHLDRMRTYSSSRERMRRLSTQAYAVVRPYTLEAGRRLHVAKKLGAPDDVYMLEVEEIIALASGKLAVHLAEERVAIRRAFYDGYRDFTPPNELGRGVVARSDASYADGGRPLPGIASRVGIAEGIARVLAATFPLGRAAERFATVQAQRRIAASSAR